MKELDYESLKLKEKINRNDLQTLIGKELKNGPKTEDDFLKAYPNIKYEDLIAVLKNMLFLKLITKEGYPITYSLSKEVLEQLEKKKRLREGDKNQLLVSILIESKSNNKGDLRKATEEIASALKKDADYHIHSIEIADIILHDDLFSTYISAELSCVSLNALFKLIYFYGTTSVEILRPDKLTVGISDLQQASKIIVDMTHGYADMIFKLSKENAELSRVR